MSGAQQHDRRTGWRPGALGLLIGAVIAGIIGMHGLSPGLPALPAPAHHGSAPSVTHSGECDSGDCGGHSTHLGPECQSGALNHTAPVVLDLALDSAVCAPRHVRPATAAVDAARGSGRGPPSLSQLSILRI
ncbi:DUF6153 family protein [Herbihabitans rhizosphaerae]|uniref:DUF6153 family protein n=1 Tax=Herbihabitans rhizosphaerae TaxID=1872711 RepID=UPI00102C8A25|nr:DUF6153 family protein [Herbihabitans rhizosphaerae]